MYPLILFAFSAYCSCLSADTPELPSQEHLIAGKDVFPDDDTSETSTIPENIGSSPTEPSPNSEKAPPTRQPEQYPSRDKTQPKKQTKSP